MILRGRHFTAEELGLIKNIVRIYWSEGRRSIAKVICERLNWRAENGRLKLVSALEALRRMEQYGHLLLPKGKTRGGYHRIKPLTSQQVDFDEPTEEITQPIKKLGRLRFELAQGGKQRLWRYLIQNYHYLGYTRLVGRHLKYFVYLGDKLVALLGFSDGIYHHRLRDAWLGWDEKTRASKRHLIVNNSRFLILPWVRVKNLGSKILGRAAKIVPYDWQRRYGYRPLFFETFVDVGNFSGTVYRAANWRYLGRTRGKGRRGLRYFFHGKFRDYYIYPLFREHGCLND